MSEVSIAARFIATWDTIILEPGPDRVVLKGSTDVTSRTSQSASLGVTYDQIDQLVIDLLIAKRDHAGNE